MDENLTKKIQDWLNQPNDTRDIKAGALLLLKINRNKVLYNNIIAKPKRMAAKLEYELKKQLMWRLKKVTHDQVAEMEDKVQHITSRQPFKEENIAPDFKAGIREDHDALPDEIKAMYVENKSIMQRMRDLHARLRVIQGGAPGYTCKDSDKYPLLKALIELDKKYHENWAAYDAYGHQPSENDGIDEARQENRRALAFINFNKNKYRENPTDELKERLALAYQKVTAPTEKMVAELKELGIIQ